MSDIAAGLYRQCGAIVLFCGMGAASLVLRIRVASGKTVVMGPGRADLLMLIGETGSIAAAGRRMGMSYKRAWALVETLNGMFASPLVEAAKGGAGGGGAKLTAEGAAVLAAYQTLEQAAAEAGAAALGRMAGALAVPPAVKTG